MPLQRVEISSPQGINTDLSPYELPPEIWSDGENVRFSGSGTSKVKGYAQVFPNLVIQPIAMFNWTNYDSSYWFYANETSIYRTSGVDQIDVSRTVGGAYNATLLDGWSGSFFNGTLLMNNGYDVPQYFNTVSTEMEDLTAWPASTTCAVVRPYKNYLVALDVTKPSGRFPTMVKWSDSADAGSVPLSWDETDPATQAGENVLPDSIGYCVDGKALGDTFFIYKTDSVWAMQFIGGSFVFAFRKVFNDVGALNKDCIADIGGRHFVVGPNDVYIHDGTTKQSVITNKFKDELYTQISTNGTTRVKTAVDLKNKEVLVYFPSTAVITGLADTCLVWNWQTNEWSKRTISNVSHIASGDVNPQASDTWEGDTAAWDTDATAWGEGAYNPATASLLMADYANSKFYRLNSTTQLDGSAYTAYVERVGIDLGNDQVYKYVTAIVPHFSGEGEVDILVGGEDRQGAGVKWSGPIKFTIGQTYKADCRVSGRYLGIKVMSSNDNLWTLTGYTIEFKPAGIR